MISKIKYSLMLFFLGLPFWGVAQEKSFSDTICFESTTITKKEAIYKLRKVGFILSYTTHEIDYAETINLHQPCLTVKTLLEYIAPNSYFETAIKNKKIIISKKYNPVTVSGSVYDAQSKEELVGATIYLKHSNIGTYSNQQGKFSMTIPNADAPLTISYTGYKTDTIYYKKDGNTNYTITLEPYTQGLKEVHVIASPTLSSFYQTNNLQLSKSTETASSFGTPDIVATVASLPGVNGGFSGFSNYAVRGGNSSENLVLLNGIPIYNYLHFTGMLSVIDQDVLRSATFYQGLFPAQYSGRLSSVLDLKLKDGNFSTFKGSISLDLLKAGIKIEGPLIKNKLSFMYSLRTSTLNYPFQLLFKDSELNYQLIDNYAQLTYRANEKNRFYFSTYFGQDKFKGIINYNDLHWGNYLTSFSWQYQLNDKALLTTKAYYSYYKNKSEGEKDNIGTADERTIISHNKIQDIALQSNLNWTLKNNNSIKAGISAIRHSTQIENNNEQQTGYSETLNSCEYRAYVDFEIALNKHWMLGIGSNLALYNTQEKMFFNFLPKVRVSYSPSPTQIFYTGYSKMDQFYHELSSSLYSTPNDFRVNSNKDLAPALSGLGELGYRWLISPELVFDISYFIRNTKNRITFKPGQDLEEHWAEDWKDRIIIGSGKSMGGTASLQWKPRPFELHGSITYTSAFEQYDGINKNKKFRAGNFPMWMGKLSARVAINNKWSCAIQTGFNSGKYITLPQFELNNPFNPPTFNDKPNYSLSPPSSYRLPQNLMINLSCAYSLSKPDERIEKLLRFGVVNIAGRAEPLFTRIYLNNRKPVIETASIPTFFPNISYEIKF